MPLFEYRCLSCQEEFEALVRAGDVPACPACGHDRLERLLTAFAVSTAERSRRALASARDAYRRSRTRTDRLRHEAEEIRAHLQEDYGVEPAPKPGRARNTTP